MRPKELCLTNRALEDLGLEAVLAKLPADQYVDEREVVRGFAQTRGTNPLGQETTQLPVISAIV